MNTIEITDLADLKPGDTATFEVRYDPHTATVTGEVWSNGRGGPLLVGSVYVRNADGTNIRNTVLISATRPAPTLPTEPGSVILASEVRRVALDPPVMCMVDPAVKEWFSSDSIGGHRWHHSEQITSWTLAKVVPA